MMLHFENYYNLIKRRLYVDGRDANKELKNKTSWRFLMTILL